MRCDLCSRSVFFAIRPLFGPPRKGRLLADKRAGEPRNASLERESSLIRAGNVERIEKRGDPPQSHSILVAASMRSSRNTMRPSSAFEAAYKLRERCLVSATPSSCRHVQFGKRNGRRPAPFTSRRDERQRSSMSNEHCATASSSLRSARRTKRARALPSTKLPFPTETPAYYYAQAAWAFAHEAKSDGENGSEERTRFSREIDRLVRPAAFRFRLDQDKASRSRSIETASFFG